jgi:hypothetical protein
VCSQERAISDTIAALGDGADHERNKHARNAKPLHPIHYFSIELSMPFRPLGLAASRTSGPLTEDSERVTRQQDVGWARFDGGAKRPGSPLLAYHAGLLLIKRGTASAT